MGCGASAAKPPEARSESPDKYRPSSPRGISASDTSKTPTSQLKAKADEEAAPLDYPAIEAGDVWKTVAALGPKPTPPLEPKINMAVSLRGVPNHAELDGSGAKLIDGPREKAGRREWDVQPENEALPPLVVPEECITPLPPLPTLGVSAECLRHFRQTNPDRFEAGATTTDICLEVVLPLTKASRSSVALCLQRAAEADADSPVRGWVGPATVFVSHAWRYQARHVFDTMLAFADREVKRGAGPTYFWFDLFTNDQHDATALPQIWWREAFLQGVERIGHTLLVLSPWKDPIPLTRAWCLWEILSTMRVKSSLTVEMAPAEAADFAHNLETNFDVVEGAVSRVDGRRADGWKAEDVKMIKSAVEATVGFTELNSMITSRLRDWLYEQGKAALDRVPIAKRCTCALAHNLTLLLLRQGKLEEAEELARESLAARARASMVEALDNAEEVNALLTKNQLARVLVDKGVFGEAEALFREAITGLERLQGATNTNTLVCKNNLADVLMQQGRIDEAEPLLLAVLDAGEVEGMESYVLSVQSNLGSVLAQKGKYAEAEPLLRKVYSDRDTNLGSRHADTLTAINNLASALRAQGKHEQAEPLYRLALDARRETLGDSHAATLSSCNNLAVLLSEARKFEDALPLLMEAFEGYRAQRGLTHPSTASLVVNVSQVLFVVPLQTEGLDAEQSRARGIAITREVLDACSAAIGDTDVSESDRAAHGRQAKMLAGHLVKLLKVIGQTEEMEKVVAEFGL